MGTPGWAAPECAMGHGAVRGSDVFSFGIIVWEVLTFLQPSVAVTRDENTPAHVLEILEHEKGEVTSPVHAQADRASLVSVCESFKARALLCEMNLRPPIPTILPPSLGALLSRCWHKAPIERPDFDEVLSELDQDTLFYIFDHLTIPFAVFDQEEEEMVVGTGKL